MDLASLQSCDHRRLVAEDGNQDAVQVGFAGLPIVGISGEGRMIAGHPLSQLERPGTDSFGLAIRSLQRRFIADLDELQQIEHRRARLVRTQDDGVLVGRVDGGKPLGHAGVLGGRH